jgi:hypothetical protein
MDKLLILLLVSVCTTATAQIDKSKIKAQAEEAAQALLKGDYDVMAKFIYPKIAEQHGGVEKMMKAAKVDMEMLKEIGITLDSIVVGEPTDPLKAGDQLHCLVPETMVVRKPDGKVTTESYLFAVSDDQGNHWYFISMTNLTANAIKELLPYYNPELVIPEKKPSVFKPD